MLEPLGDQIRIDPIRDLRRDLHMRPFEAERRVYLVLRAHLLNEDAADALLKDLEEPPPYAVIVLVADELGLLPPTIRSRCQLVPFRRLSQRAIKAFLSSRGLEGEPLDALARVAAGRLDRAERLLDPDAGERRDGLIELARSVYRDPAFDPAQASRVVTDFAQERADGRARRSRRSRSRPRRRARREQRGKRAGRGAEREEVLDALDLLAGWYRDLMVVAAGAEGAVLNSDRLAELSADGLPERGPGRRARGRDRARSLALVRVQRPARAGARGALRPPPARAGRHTSVMTLAVGVVFSPGGKVYSFDPGGLELAWNEKVICQTSRGQELGPGRQGEPRARGRAARAAEEGRSPRDRGRPRDCRGEPRGGEAGHARLPRGRQGAGRRAEARRRRARLRRLAAGLLLRGGAAGPDAAKLQAALRERLHRRVELRSVGPRECARLCGDHGLCGGGQCSRRYPTHEQPITLAHGQGPGPAHELGPDHGPVRPAALLPRLRAPALQELPRPRAARGPARRDAARRGRRHRLQGPRGRAAPSSSRRARPGSTCAIDECREVRVSPSQTTSTRRLEDYRSLRRDLERAVVPLATSVDGRRFTFQASLHDLALQAGGYVVLENDGEPRLGQVITLEPASREGPSSRSTLARRVSRDTSMLLRYAQGEGVVLEGDGAPFHDAAARPASRPRSRPGSSGRARAGALRSASSCSRRASRSRSTPAASTGTRFSAASPAPARRTRSGSSWSSSCSRPTSAS